MFVSAYFLLLLYKLLGGGMRSHIEYTKSPLFPETNDKTKYSASYGPENAVGVLSFDILFKDKMPKKR